MIATAIIAGVTAAASLAGGIAKTIQAKRNARRQQAQLDKMKSDNEAWYQRRYNEDFTQRSDIQNALQQARETLIRQNNAAAGAQAVIGGTDASVAAQKEASNAAYAQAVANAAAGASAAKDRVEDRYLTTKNQLVNQQIASDQARTDANAAAIDTAVQGINAAGQAFVAGSNLDGKSTGDATGSATPTRSSVGADITKKTNESIASAYTQNMQKNNNMSLAARFGFK